MPAIQGIVLREDQPLGSAYVRCHGPSGEFVAEIYTGDDGRFTFHVSEGEWRIEARAAQAETAEQRVRVAGADESIELRLN